ncbi:phage tail terminator-like protein [Mesoterricola silvestris]|uniref:phage tail terminator-like protein n=1 Tax=Mesoterricola silvestris TaxID=2927979 RepID=UPI00292CBFE0|nr:phage tail terminator-like protein [Mesoterricola silvestris]
MSINLCRAAGEIQLKALPGLDPALVALPGIAFTKPSPAVLFFRYDFIPTGSWRALGDPSKRFYRGIFQITPCAPAGKGLAALTMAVDAVIAQFGHQRLIQGGVTLDTEDANPGPVNTETDWVSCPVSIAFETR